MPAHVPALAAETIELLALRPGDVAVDATCGAGGHTALMAEAVGAGGTVIALDQDEAALTLARERLGNAPQVRFVHANFRHVARALRSFAIERVDAVCADLGMGSFQIDAVERGFSFRSEQELDMRMNRAAGATAAEMLRTLPADEIGRIFREWGEEPRWRAVARGVVAHRQAGGEFTGPALRGIVHRAAGAARRRGVDAATQVFQALRIAVNDELGALAEFLPAALELLRPGGRLAVISYHSLEDRLVKNFFRNEAKGCICPPDLPRCVCGREPRLRLATRKAVAPSAAEVQRNPRARSAHLRAAERI
jgi:16S rRNA (cytosine1402-N4)-methyltransferase